MTNKSKTTQKPDSSGTEKRKGKNVPARIPDSKDYEKTRKGN